MRTQKFSRAFCAAVSLDVMMILSAISNRQTTSYPQALSRGHLPSSVIPATIKGAWSIALTKPRKFFLERKRDFCENLDQRKFSASPPEEIFAVMFKLRSIWLHDTFEFI